MKKNKNTNKFTKTAVIEVEGDALHYFFNSKGTAVFMHGANCQKVMGAGIASQVREQLAALFYADQFDPRSPSTRFGSYSAVVLGSQDNSPKIGVNLYTQYRPGKYFDIDALRTALKGFVFSIPDQERGDMEVILPEIGCGIGGGNWDEVKPVITEILKEFSITFVKYVASPLVEDEDSKTDPQPSEGMVEQVEANKVK